MGWFDRRRQRNAERAAQQRAQAQAAEVAAWQAEDDEVRHFLDEARTNQGVDDGFGLVLKRNERTFQVLEGPSLIEPRRLPGHWEGRSQGFSIPITSGVRYRVGSTKGQYVQGNETPTPIDTGTVTITNQRVVFQGTKATREWAFTKVLGVQHVDDPKWPWTAIQVSNRQKTSGFTYPAELAGPVRFRLDLALAHFHGEVEDFIADIEEQVAEHELERPSAALPTHQARPPSQPAGWKSDPTGRHERRYWDGNDWTEHVVDGDRPAVDPV
jgi:hypothetical protein